MAKAYTLFLMGVGLIAFGMMNIIYLRYNKNHSLNFQQSGVDSGLNQIEGQVQLRSVMPNSAEEINQEGSTPNKVKIVKEKAYGKAKKSKKHSVKKHADGAKECNPTINANQKKEQVQVSKNPTEAQTHAADSILTPEPTTPVSYVQEVESTAMVGTSEPVVTLPITESKPVITDNPTETQTHAADSILTPEPTIPVSYVQEVESTTVVGTSEPVVTLPITESKPVITDNPTETQTHAADSILTPEPTIPVSYVQEVESTTVVGTSEPVVTLPITESKPVITDNPEPAQSITPLPEPKSPKNETVSPTTVNPSDVTVTTSPMESPSNETPTIPVKEETKPKLEEKKKKKKIHKKEKGQTETTKEINILFENEILDADESTEDDEYEPEIIDITENDDDEMNEAAQNSSKIRKKREMFLEMSSVATGVQDPVMDKAKIISEVNKSNMTVVVLLLSSFVFISITLIIAEVYSNYKKRNNPQEWVYDYMLLDEDQDLDIKCRNIRDI